LINKPKKGEFENMAKNQLFNYLKSGLHKANSEPPRTNTLVMGFTKAQVAKMDFKKPRLIWYDAFTKTFYDQGDSTKIKKSEWKNINAANFKKNAPITNLHYYIPINDTIMAESNKPLG
jgi:hypothetical protein